MEREEAERLVRTLGQRVYRFAYARLGNRADAEDVTQETFLRLVRSSPEFPDDARALAWLFQVAAHCLTDLRRHPHRWREVGLEEAEGVASFDAETDAVLEALFTLPEKYRSVLHLFYYERYTVAQIGDTLKLRQGAVKTRPHRGRELLRGKLKGGEEDA